MEVKRTNRKYLDQGERKEVSETGKNPECEGEMPAWGRREEHGQRPPGGFTGLHHGRKG